MVQRRSSKRSRSVSRGGAKGPSQRQLRAGELVRHALVDILQREDLRDLDLQGTSVTISEVRPSPDLRQATVYCMPLGAGSQVNVASKDLNEDMVIDALNRMAPYFRGLLGKKIDMKFTPALVFRKDESFDEAGRIDALLASPAVARDLLPRDDDRE